MNNTLRNGGPAFPLSVGSMQDGVLSSADFVNGAGMTLRDWFDGQFLTGIRIDGDAPADIIAKNCYVMADAMLRERAK